MAETTKTYNGYCVVCKEKRDFEGTVSVSKGMMMNARGPCPVCGNTITKVVGKMA